MPIDEKRKALEILARRGMTERDVLARGNLQPPRDRGFFGVKGAVEDYGMGMRDAGRSALNYVTSTSPGQMASDAYAFGGAMVQGMMDDPLSAAVDFIPGVGAAMGVYEAESLRNQALEAERAGQFDLAESLRAQAGSIAAMSAIPGGRTARRGARMDMADNKLPPLENAQKTQLGASTLPSYEKAARLLGGDGTFLDFGAGRGQGAAAIGADTFEPYPREGFSPTYTTAADIPDASYDRLASLNVLNVMPRDVRDQAVQDIGRVLSPGGRAVVTTRGRDVMNAKGTPGDEPMSIVTTADTYQKGFTQPELREYVQGTLGEGYTVSNLPEKIGQAGVMIERSPELAPTQSTLRSILLPGDVGYDARFSPRAQDEVNKVTGVNLSGPEKARLDQARFNYEGSPIATPEMSIVDLEGRPFMTTMSDRTAAGYTLSGIGDVQFDRPVVLRGGQDFMFDDPDLVWASDPKVVNQMSAFAQELQRGSGQSPVFLPWRMAPSGGDYATMTTDVMFEYAFKNMDPKKAAEIDDLIRKGKTVTKKPKNKKPYQVQLAVPDWKGIKNPESAAQIRNLSGDQRKLIQDYMDKQGRNAGGLSLGEARLAVSDPTQYQAAGGGLQNVGLVDALAGVTTSTHPTYRGGLPGEGMGRLKEDVQVYQLLPQEAQFRMQPRVNKKGEPIPFMTDVRNPGDNDLRALQMKPYGGVITEQMIRSVLEGN